MVKRGDPASDATCSTGRQQLWKAHMGQARAALDNSALLSFSHLAKLPSRLLAEDGKGSPDLSQTGKLLIDENSVWDLRITGNNLAARKIIRKGG